jgi:Glyoxalase-like domain
VIDHDAAAASPFGRTVLERAERGGGWLTLSLADVDIDATATRLGLKVSEGSRILPDGQTLRWRSAGIDDQGRTAGSLSSSGGMSLRGSTRAMIHRRTRAGPTVSRGSRSRRIEKRSATGSGTRRSRSGSGPARQAYGASP